MSPDTELASPIPGPRVGTDNGATPDPELGGGAAPSTDEVEPNAGDSRPDSTQAFMLAMLAIILLGNSGTSGGDAKRHYKLRRRLDQLADQVGELRRARHNHQIPLRWIPQWRGNRIVIVAMAILAGAVGAGLGYLAERYWLPQHWFFTTLGTHRLDWNGYRAAVVLFGSWLFAIVGGLIAYRMTQRDEGFNTVDDRDGALTGMGRSL